MKGEQDMHNDLYYKGSKLLTELGILVGNGSTASHLGLGLGAHNTATPMLAGLVELVVEVSLDSLAEAGKLLLVLRLDLSKGNSSSSLLVDEGTEAGLALDDGIWDAHLAAESGEPDNQLQGKTGVSQPEIYCHDFTSMGSTS